MPVPFTIDFHAFILLQQKSSTPFLSDYNIAPACHLSLQKRLHPPPLSTRNLNASLYKRAPRLSSTSTNELNTFPLPLQRSSCLPPLPTKGLPLATSHYKRAPRFSLPTTNEPHASHFPLQKSTTLLISRYKRDPTCHLPLQKSPTLLIPCYKRAPTCHHPLQMSPTLLISHYK